MSVRPIFIFSSPRSGSTLLQRVIAAHAGVATVSEPWLLLPHLGALHAASGRGKDPQALAATALHDFCAALPNGEADYRRALRDFILRLYSEAAGPDARYFLDKTPPYYLIAEEIIDLFPEARFVFLWRNPLSIIASIIETWQEGRWHPTQYSDALFSGLPKLICAYQGHSEISHVARYEDLVRGDPAPWEGIMGYLDVPFERGALESYPEVPLHGQMGDTTGARYDGLSEEPTTQWRRTLANPLRREWARRYLRWLGSERLAAMGYDIDELQDQLRNTPRSIAGLAGDARQLAQALALEPARSVARRTGRGGPSVLLPLLHA